MKLLALTAVSIGLVISSFFACQTGPSLQIPPVSGQSVSPVKKTMRPFGSEQELLSYLRKLAEKQKTRGRADALAQASVAPVL